MVESYTTRSSSRRASWKTIQEMKKNMQKVPIIQQKSNIYHQKEQEQLDEILDLAHEEENVIHLSEEQENKSIPRRKQLLHKRGFILDD